MAGVKISAFSPRNLASDLRSPVQELIETPTALTGWKVTAKVPSLADVSAIKFLAANGIF